MKKIVLSVLLVVALTFFTIAFTACGDESVENEIATKTYFTPTKAVISSSNGTSSIKIELGENNLPAKQTQIRFGELNQVCDYTYDARNNLIQLVSTDLDGEVISITENIFTSDDKLEKSYSKTADGQCMLTVLYQYDANGNVIKTLVLDADGDEAQTIIVTYDDNKLIQEDYYTDGNVSSTVYSYNSDGKLVEMRDSYGTWSYTYDASGHVVKAVCPNIYDYTKYDTTITYTLTYNENGNITQIVSTDDSGETCTVTIEYEEVTVTTNMEVNQIINITSIFQSLKSMDNVFPTPDLEVIPF